MPPWSKKGELVYATCSILPAENKLQVDKFLKSQLGSQFELEKNTLIFLI